MDSSDLRNQLDQAKGESEQIESDDEAEEVEQEPVEEEVESTDKNDAQEQAPSSEDEKDEQDEDEESELTEDERRRTPSFPYSEAKQRGLHPRAETWGEYDDAMWEAERVLREHDVKEIEKREFDDAVLRLAKKEPEKLAILVMEARELDVERDD